MGKYPFVLVIGLVFGLLISACNGPPKKLSLTELVAKQHGQAIRLGDEVKLMLPSNALFVVDSANLKPSAHCILNQMVNLFNYRENCWIKVAAYADNQPSSLDNLTLSRQQALVIADYLLRNGLNTPVIYASGYGDKRPIGARTQQHNPNQRIEISTRWFHHENAG